ncbi:MAG: TIGR03790 family protein [Gammaproteobacteria bacterium]
MLQRLAPPATFVPSLFLLFLLFLLFVLSLAAPTRAYAQFTAPRGLQSAQLAIVINDADPDSVAVGAYYRKARQLPAANVVHVSIPGKPKRIDPNQFARLREKIDSQLPAGIEAVLMVWTAPYAVNCNSITSAYTLGYDEAQCRNGCAAGKPSPYYNANVARPFSEFGMRLSMLLPTDSVADAKALIDRGVASGFRTVPASAYYLVTSQTARNSRAPMFPRSAAIPARKFTIKTARADVLEDKHDIMVYQTGVAKVDKLDTLTFLPGALADHLTSFGGDLLGTDQMSSLRWLKAGATASYGTVSEPCNHWQKFPQPAVLLQHYLNGASAIEAYWRSVAWPAQGLFIGEPLAAPYRR